MPSCIRNLFFYSIALLGGLLMNSLLIAQSGSTRPDAGGENRKATSAELRDIHNEQSELRRELNMLKQHVDHLKRRLERLSQISEFQLQLDRIITRQESATSEEDSRKLDPQIESLERKIDRMREVMEIETELADRIVEVLELKERLGGLPKTETTTRSSRYLTIAIGSLQKMRQLQSELGNPAGISEDRHEPLEQAIDELQERIDFESELTELAFRFIEAVQANREEETGELTDEIRDILEEMENQPPIRTPRTPAEMRENGRGHEQTEAGEITEPGTITGEPGTLESGQYFIQQSWSQETDYPRPYFVNVPEGKASQKFPVFIFLHGNGGNAKEVMRILLRNRKKMAAEYVMVFAQGYRESWNIVSERSKADDIAFIEAIVLKIASYENVQNDNFSIMGASNGAALVNQLMIESRLPNIRNYISGVSPLNVWQYDGKQFKSKGSDNNYRESTIPITGKRLMNISGTEDALVPYEGGISRHIPAKDGKLGFLAAEESTYVWAKQMGHSGKKLTTPSRTEGQLEVFSYLEGDVVHYKVVGAGHGATHEISEESLLRFLDNEKTTSSK